MLHCPIRAEQYAIKELKRHWKDKKIAIESPKSVLGLIL